MVYVHVYAWLVGYYLWCVMFSLCDCWGEVYGVFVDGEEEVVVWA